MQDYCYFIVHKVRDLFTSFVFTGSFATMLLFLMVIRLHNNFHQNKNQELTLKEPQIYIQVTVVLVQFHASSCTKTWESSANILCLMFILSYDFLYGKFSRHI